MARHGLLAPGEVALLAAHYGGPRRAPVGAPRPRSAAEKAFLALGQDAERFLVAAAAAGTPRLAGAIAAINELAAAWGDAALAGALARAEAFRCFHAADLASILAAGEGLPGTVAPGRRLAIELPAVPVRALADCALAVTP